MARSTLASSSTSSSVSAMVSLERGADQHRERAGQQRRLKRRRARHLAVELHGTWRALGHSDAHRASARPPDTASLSISPPQELNDRAGTLKRAVRVERDDIEPAVIGSERGAQREKSRR